jgi:hypothetical protein
MHFGISDPDLHTDSLHITGNLYTWVKSPPNRAVFAAAFCALRARVRQGSNSKSWRLAGAKFAQLNFIQGDPFWISGPPTPLLPS